LGHHSPGAFWGHNWIHTCYVQPPPFLVVDGVGVAQRAVHVEQHGVDAPRRRSVGCVILSGVFHGVLSGVVEAGHRRVVAYKPRIWKAKRLVREARRFHKLWVNVNYIQLVYSPTAGAEEARAGCIDRKDERRAAVVAVAADRVGHPFVRDEEEEERRGVPR
jgi:hypothetical protein